MTDAGAAIARFDFNGGGLRGTHLTLYGNCLVHQGGGLLETLPLSAIASVRVAFERDERKLRWAVGLVVIAALLFAVSAPVASFAGGAAAEMAGAGAQGVARALHALFQLLLQDLFCGIRGHIHRQVRLHPAGKYRRARRQGYLRHRHPQEPAIAPVECIPGDADGAASQPPTGEIPASPIERTDS